MARRQMPRCATFLPDRGWDSSADCAVNQQIALFLLYKIAPYNIF